MTDGGRGAYMPEENRTWALETSVLIVGGGLNGLTMAALLARHGVDCLVVEHHESTSIQYKFAGISPRSMEIFRQIGVEEEIRANRTGNQQGGGIARGRTLSDPELVWGGPAWPDTSGSQPDTAGDLRPARARADPEARCREAGCEDALRLGLRRHRRIG